MTGTHVQAHHRKYRDYPSLGWVLAFGDLANTGSRPNLEGEHAELIDMMLEAK